MLDGPRAVARGGHLTRDELSWDGCAGGFGALINFDLIAKSWPHASNYLVDDSGPALESSDIPDAIPVRTYSSPSASVYPSSRSAVAPASCMW